MSDTEKKCPVCETGQHQPWSMAHSYCEEHNVCISCGIKRKQLDHAPWGVRIGAFLCNPCSEREKAERIAERIEKGFEHDYEDEVVCPHCGYEHSDSWEMRDGEHECPECDKKFELECHHSVTYSTTKPKES